MEVEHFTKVAHQKFASGSEVRNQTYTRLIVWDTWLSAQTTLESEFDNIKAIICRSTDKNACCSVRGIAKGLHYIHEATNVHADLVNGLVEDGKEYEEQSQMGSDTVMRFVMIMLTVNLKNQSAHDDGITISVKPII